MTPDTEGKSLVELFDMLIPAPAPAPISMWPQTWGSVGVAAVVVAGLAAAAFVAWRHWRANSYRRQALAALDRCGTDPAQVARILRRTALAAFPRRCVASLQGEEWVTFLRQTADLTMFSENTARSLIMAPYATGVDDPTTADMARAWIRTHKVERMQK